MRRHGPAASTGRPRTRIANATPHNTAGNHEPAAIPTSAAARHAGSSIFPRHSIATERRIMPTRMTSSGRYNAEKTVAYQPGNAANMAAPAVISHTSLPSHTGPIVLSAARRCFSRSPTPTRASGSINMPTPKSKPSRMKKARNSMPMMPNHNSCSLIGQLLSRRNSIGERQRRDLVIARRMRRGRLRVVFAWPFGDVTLQQPEPGNRQHRVEHGVGHQ